MTFEAHIEEQKQRVRDELISTSDVMNQAILLCRKDPDTGKRLKGGRKATLYLAMPDLDDAQIRSTVQDAAWEHGAVAAFVTISAWTVTTSDAVAQAVVQELVADGRLHEHPDAKEIVIFMAESLQHRIRRWHATIVRQDDDTELGPWTEDEIRLPYATFRRYLPETRDGKRARVITTPGSPVQTVVVGEKADDRW